MMRLGSSISYDWIYIISAKAPTKSAAATFNVFHFSLISKHNLGCSTFHTLTRQKKRLAVPRAFPGTFWIPPKSISVASWIFSRCLQDAPRSSNCTLNNHDKNKHLFGIISCALRLLNFVWCSTLLTKAPLLGSALALSISYFKIHQIIFVVGHRLILA